VWYGGFTIYAGAVALFTHRADQMWAVWAVGAYAVTTALLWLIRNWVIPMVTALAGALIVPTAYLVLHGPPIAEVEVIGRSASLLVRHGTPYLSVGQLTAWTSYNPYLPVMEIFGLPGAAGLRGLAGDPRVWATLFTVALLALALGIMATGNPLRCRQCRVNVTRQTVFALASPVFAFPLALGITDPPIITLLLLTLACAYRGWLLRAALALGVACAMKYTAWPALPVVLAMLISQRAPALAARFTSITVGATAAMTLLAAPAAMAAPDAVIQNTVAFPLGLAKHRTPAQSPLPGHLLASLGKAGHDTAIGLMVAAAVAFMVWLWMRPPRDARGVAVRLVVAYTAIFSLAPDTRWGYFAYPLGLLGWLALTRTFRQPSILTTELRAEAPGVSVGELGGGGGVDCGAGGGQDEAGRLGV
jgi:hypothetical protein